MTHAEQNRLKSIAIPTLGCGNLQYPVKEVIDCFQQAAQTAPNVQVIFQAFTKIPNCMVLNWNHLLVRHCSRGVSRLGEICNLCIFLMVYIHLNRLSFISMSFNSYLLLNITFESIQDLEQNSCSSSVVWRC